MGEARSGWFVRAIALLLAALGLQTGSLRDLDGSHDWYFGSPDSRAPALLEPRRADGLGEAEGALPEGAPALAARPSGSGRPPARAGVARLRLRDPLRVADPAVLFPDQTGPPRA